MSVPQSSLSTIKGIIAKLEMKPDTQPKVCKARPVPYALQEAVDVDCHRLESEGTVKKVGFSEWAPPMAHVPKADGATRSLRLRCYGQPLIQHSSVSNSIA